MISPSVIDSKWDTVVPEKKKLNFKENNAITNSNITILFVQFILVVMVLVTIRPSFVLTANNEVGLALLNAPQIGVIALLSIAATIMICKSYIRN